MACDPRSHVLFFLVALLSLVLGAASNADPCFEASTLHNADRRTKSSNSSHGICDLHINTTWFRVSTGKGSDLLTSCPPLMGCGNSFPVWLNDTIPDVSEGEVDRAACVTSLLSCCVDVLTVRVKNCGGFRVWRLPPTLACPQAYCFEDPETTRTTVAPGAGSTTSGFPPTPTTDRRVHSSPNDNDDLNGFEHAQRMRVMEITLGVVATFLVLSLVLNGVLLYMCKTRNRSCMSQAEEKYGYCKETASSDTKIPDPRALGTPPPPYEMFMSPNQPKLNSWVDMKNPSRF